ncbi:MAG: hypothetical protein GY739_09905 [Mesoflavibacter sp.]|nr:hypothetical protein [Mesoflavibacter sp.]
MNDILDTLRTSSKYGRNKYLAKNRANTIIILNLNDLLHDIPSLRTQDALRTWIKEYQDLMARKYKKVRFKNIIFFGNPYYYDLDLYSQLKDVTQDLSSLRLILSDQFFYKSFYTFLKVKRVDSIYKGLPRKHWLSCRDALLQLIDLKRSNQQYRDGYIYSINVALYKSRKSLFKKVFIPRI